MSALSDYMENKILEHMFRNQAHTPPATIYLALCTTATNDAGGGTEVTGNGYARTAIPLASAAAAGLLSNSGVITFPAASGGAWGLCSHVKICDASTAGNVMMHGALTVSKQIDDGDVFEMLTGELDMSMA